MNILAIRSQSELQAYVNQGKKVKYVFFWGHQVTNSISKTCFSQWYDAPFTEDDVQYMTAEHYMMAEKAKLFEDTDCYQKIIHAKNPGEAKALGRTVKYFDDETWVANRFDIVVRGNLLKFSQNPTLGDFLVNTGKRVLVEASPVDKVWGVGLAADNPNIENPNNWKGLNLLGFALMEVREQLKMINASV